MSFRAIAFNGAAIRVTRSLSRTLFFSLISLARSLPRFSTRTRDHRRRPHRRRRRRAAAKSLLEKGPPPRRPESTLLRITYCSPGESSRGFDNVTFSIIARRGGGGGGGEVKKILIRYKTNDKAIDEAKSRLFFHLVRIKSNSCRGFARSFRFSFISSAPSLARVAVVATALASYDATSRFVFIIIRPGRCPRLPTLAWYRNTYKRTGYRYVRGRSYAQRIYVRVYLYIAKRSAKERRRRVLPPRRQSFFNLIPILHALELEKKFLINFRRINLLAVHARVNFS